MTRIIAGSAGGRKLAVPGGKDARSTRPTTDRVREALFASLVSSRGGLAGDAVLDLFAGSGALGLEAVSRGAASATLVEADAAAAAVARANAAAVGLAASVRVVRSTVTAYLATAPTVAVASPTGAAAPATGAATRGAGPARFDLVVADPPWALPAAEADAVLARLAAGWLAPGATVVLERGKRDPGPAWPAGFDARPVRLYGETALWVGEWIGADADPGGGAGAAGD